MTPKEKAEELVEKFTNLNSNKISDYSRIEYPTAKQCALIAVEEVRFFHDKLFYATEGSIFDKYLNEVKQEINKL
jgi:hypothetical protein